MKNRKSLTVLIIFMIIMIILTVVFGVLYINYKQIYMIYLYNTFFTISYHFLMRVMVGEFITILYKNREFHYNAWWYQQHSFEKKLYSFLRIKKLKSNAITAKPELFDLKNNSYNSILHNITQAEIVHEIIVVLSFVPMIMIIWYGEVLIYTLTSVFAAICDLFFVIIQRYNRPRVLKLIKYMEKRGNKNVF